MFKFLRRLLDHIEKTNGSASGESIYLANNDFSPYDKPRDTHRSVDTKRSGDIKAPTKYTNQERIQPNKQPYSSASSQENTAVRLVNQVSTADMLKFSLMPFDLNAPIKKIIKPHAKPFAYIDIGVKNQAVVKKELTEMNRYIALSTALSPRIPRDILIPVDNIIFVSHNDSNYTHLKCTPYTAKGNVSKYPLCLYFTTPTVAETSTTHGQLFYGVDGRVAKGDVHFWKNHVGYHYYFKTVGRTLTIAKIEMVMVSAAGATTIVIYELTQ